VSKPCWGVWQQAENLTVLTLHAATVPSEIMGCTGSAVQPVHCGKPHPWCQYMQPIVLQWLLWVMSHPTLCCSTSPPTCLPALPPQGCIQGTAACDGDVGHPGCNPPLSYRHLLTSPAPTPPPQSRYTAPDGGCHGGLGCLSCNPIISYLVISHPISLYPVLSFPHTLASPLGAGTPPRMAAAPW
jgi:hypothetical protein